MKGENEVLHIGVGAPHVEQPDEKSEYGKEEKDDEWQFTKHVTSKNSLIKMHGIRHFFI